MKNTKAMKSNVTYVRPPWLLSILFLFSTTIFSNLSNAQRQNLVMETGFEGSLPFAGFQYGNQFCCSYSVTQSSAFARAGNSSVKFDLRSSDPIVSSSVRAEIEPNGAGGASNQEMERWYGLSYYLSNYGADNGAECILQWHDVDGTCPPLSIQIQGGRMRIQQCINNTNTPNDLGPVVSNQWFDIVMHVKWTTSNTGIIQVWKDGVLMVNKSGIRTNSTGGSYMKVGINKWTWAPPASGISNTQTQRIFYIDEFRIGNENATYADVAPSSTAPPPPGNQPPTASAGNNINLTLPANSTTLNGSGTDPEHGTLTYAWARVSGPTTYNLGTANAATSALSNLVAGTYVFRLTVTDNAGATATDDITVTVTAPVNEPPTANAGNNITLTLPENSTTLNGRGTDPENGTLTYAWTRVSGPTTYNLGTANAASTNLSNLVAGTYVFRLTVTDNGSLTATDNVTVTVNPAVNEPPTANAGNNITLTLPENSTTLNGRGTDPENGTLTYAWTRVSGPTTYNLGTANAASTSLSNLVAGTYVFRLTVTDDGSLTATDNVTVTVNAAPNQAPVARAGNDMTTTLPIALVTLDGSASSDPDGNIQSYSWSRISGPTTFSLLSPLSAISIVNSLLSGTYVFRLTVTDNDGVSSTDDVSVVVNALPVLNQPPVVNAGNDRTLVLPANSTQLQGTATDADGTIATRHWEMISGPATYTIEDPAAGTTDLTGLVQGTYVFSFKATDDDGASDIDYLTITVNAPATSPNQSPAANAGNDVTLTLPANSTTLTGSGIDPDGTIDGYAWSKISGPTTFSLGTPGSFNTTLTNLVKGIYVFRLTVTDNDGATASAFVTVTVNAAIAPPNQPPTADAGNDITLTLPTNSTTLSGSGTDPDNNIVSYAWSKISGSNTYLMGTPGAATTTLSDLVQGVYVFRLTVADANGAIATAFVTVTVNPAPPPPNQAPTANAGNNITITLPASSTTLTGSGTDADGNIRSYAWARVSGPTTFTMANAGASSTGLSNLVQGVYVFRLTVTDDDNATATDNVTVTVNPAPVPSNQAPTANAGNNITITLPANSTTLTGSGTDADGNIRSYAWTRISGPTTFTMANASASSTGLSNLVQGVYMFRLTVTDDDNATAADDVTVTVNPAPPPPNQAPVAKAGNDVVMTLPTSATTLNGSASTDADGRIMTYAWVRISGPTTYTFANAAGASNAVTGLVQGTYVFRLTVTDDDNATDTDDITVVVNPAPAPPPPANKPPVANAGTDIVVTLPDNTATLYGTGSSDPDGVISAYEWREISGPSQLVIANRVSSSLQLADLMIGEYIFELKVTDNRNASSTIQVKVIVKTQSGEGLYCNVYPNPASSNLNIEYSGNNTGKVDITIYDASNRFMTGETVVKTQATLRKTVDVSSYTPGTYFLQIILSGNKKIVKKFVKL